MSESRVINEITGDAPIGVGRVQLVSSRWSGKLDQTRVRDVHTLCVSFMPAPHKPRGRLLSISPRNHFETLGQMYFVPAMETLHTRSDDYPRTSDKTPADKMYDALICDFDPAQMSSWLDEDQSWRFGKQHDLLDVHNRKVQQLALGIRSEIQNPGLASKVLLESMGAQLAVELARHFADTDDDAAKGGLAPWRLRLIQERVAAEGPAPGLAELAQLCGMSVRHLTRGFRKSRNQSLGQFISDQRILRSQRLLAEGLPVKLVASAMGFADPSNFSSAFRRVFGVSPRTYRLSSKTGASLKQ